MKNTSKQPKCPICRHNTHLFHQVKDTAFKRTFSYYRCDSCAHLFIQPILSEKQLFNEYIYDDFTPKEKTMVSQFVKWIITAIFNSEIYKGIFGSKRFLRKAVTLFEERTHRSPKSYLDYGCGNAPNLQYFHELLPSAKRLGYEKSINSTQLHTSYVTNKITQVTKQKYDIISLFHVFEHIIDMPEFFSILKKISHKETLLLIQIPHGESIDTKVIPQWGNEFILRTPYHINIFSRKSLELFLKKYGYHIVDFNYEIYQTHSLIENKSIFLKILLTPLMIAIALYAKLTKQSNVVTAYISENT